MAPALPIGVVVDDLIDRVEPAPVLVDSESHPLERSQHFPLRPRLARRVQRVHERLQVARRGHAGVDLAHAAGRGVARVDEARLARNLHLPVQLLEPSDRELLRRPAANALRRRVGSDEVGPLFLDAAQVQHQRVEFRIRDLRLVENEVSVLVAPDLFTQSLDSALTSPLAGRPGGDVRLTHFVRGASMPDRILRPDLSNFTSSSSSVRVSVLFTTVPIPNAACVTRSPVAKRCTGGPPGAACTRPSWNLSL